MKSRLREGFEVPSVDHIDGPLPHPDKLVYDYIVASDKHQPTSELFLSNLGMCPRKLILEKQGATIEKPESAEWNRQRLFQQANNVADDMAEALHHAGRLCAMEESITDLLPEPWGGRFDILALYPGRRFWEVKSGHPNQLRYAASLPKRYQVWQVLGYELWAGYAYATEYGPLVHNADRGGQNPSILSEVEMPQDWWDFRTGLKERISVEELYEEVRTVATGDKAGQWTEIIVMLQQMLDLEFHLVCWKERKTIPEVLDRTPAHTMSKRGELFIPTKVYLDRDWRCTRCDFCDTAYCDPPKGQTGILEWDWEENEWRVMRNGRPYLHEAVAYLKEEVRMPHVELEGGEQETLLD